MDLSQLAPGIHEVQSFEVDEFDCIRGIVCGGQTILEAGAGRPDGRLPFQAIFSDHRTSALYGKLVEHVRETAETISFPYRCDSETHCVYQRAVVFLSSSRHVAFLNKVTGFNTWPAGVRLVREVVDEGFEYHCCSICNRFNSVVGDTIWYEFQALVEINQWLTGAHSIRCTFDVCNDCEHALAQRMAESVRPFVRRAT